jgi:hypothetical protein
MTALGSILSLGTTPASCMFQCRHSVTGTMPTLSSILCLLSLRCCRSVTVPALGTIRCDPIIGLAMPAPDSKYSVTCGAEGAILPLATMPAPCTLRATPALFDALYESMPALGITLSMMYNIKKFSNRHNYLSSGLNC